LLKFVQKYILKKKDTCLILNDAVTPLTTQLVSEIKMVAQILDCDRRFQMSCKAFLSGKSPWITLTLAKSFIKVRIHCLFFLNLAFFTKICNFPQIVRSDPIWGQLCDIAPLRNIRWPVQWNKYTHRTLSSKTQWFALIERFCQC